MVCWRCGTTLDTQDTVCPECGAKKPTPRRSSRASHGMADQYGRPIEASGGAAAISAGAAEGRRRGSSQGPASSAKAETAERVASRGSAPNRPEAGEQPAKPRRAGSMPPAEEALWAGQGAGFEDTDPNAPRMVRRHAYDAITPAQHGYDHINWLRLCAIAVLCVIVLTAGVYIFLGRSAPGQRWLAANGRDASMEAYHEIGRMYMTEGSISRAIWALEIAQAKDPNNLEVLIDLGKAYMGNNDEADAEIAYTRAIQFWPEYPEPYRRLIDNLTSQNRNYEALNLTIMAMENTEDSYFDTLYARLIPETPSASPLSNRFETEQDITLTAEEGAEIYYTLRGEDPIEEGLLYTGPIHLVEDENQQWRIRAVAFKDGMYSDEQIQNYTIIKPKPDMPKTNLAVGTYDTVKTVSLRPGGKDPVQIYYTIDGTQPTENSKLFEEPITLRIGKTNLRAIAINADGKKSNELNLTYKCNVRTKTSMGDGDVIDKLKLFSTTREAFEETYGAPQAELDDGTDLLGAYTKLVYSFGYATFLDRGGDKPVVLVELSTISSAFAAPRDTRVGSRMEEVIEAYRDEGGEENMQGNRTLYIYTDGRLGMQTKLGENEYELGYYFKLESNGHHIALIYHVTNGLVDKIDWLQYEASS